MFNVLKRIGRGIGRGLLGIVIWPISTALTLRRMCKLLRDTEIPCCHTDCDEIVDEYCCDFAKERLTRNRPDVFGLDCMRYYSTIKYQLSKDYILWQKYTIFWYAVNIVIWTPVFSVNCKNASPSINSTSCAISMAFYNIGIDSLMKFLICALNENAYNTALSAVKYPWRALTHYKSLQCHNAKTVNTQDLVFKSYFKAGEFWLAWLNFVKPANYNLRQNIIEEFDAKTVSEIIGVNRRRSDLVNFNSELVTVNNRYSQARKLIADTLEPFFTTDNGRRTPQGVIPLVLNYYSSSTLMGMVRDKNGIRDRNYGNSNHDNGISNHNSSNHVVISVNERLVLTHNYDSANNDKATDYNSSTNYDSFTDRDNSSNDYNYSSSDNYDRKFKYEPIRKAS